MVYPSRDAHDAQTGVDHSGEAPYTIPLCIIVDYNIAWICKPLKRRGILVYCPEKDYTDLGDQYLLEQAQRLGCIVVSKDKYFENKQNTVYITHREEYRRNSWELITRIIKQAALRKRISTLDKQGHDH